MTARFTTALWSLVKPRIVALLCLTGASGLVATGGATPGTLIAFVVAGACMAAGAAGLNCWYDRDIDPKMERTADRALPAGDLDAGTALGASVAFIALGTAVGVLALPLVSVTYMWLGLAAYVGLYTIALKRRHWMGVVLGGSAGSFPVLAGWTVVEPLSLDAVGLAALVFVWTPAHAWALAHVYRDDFAAADIPTYPVVKGIAKNRRAVWVSALVTVALALALTPVAGTAYTVAVILGSPLYLVAYLAYYRGGSEPEAVRAFFTSNLYLAVVFLAWAVGGILPAIGPLGTVLEAAIIPFMFVKMWTARPGLRGVEGAVGGEWLPAVRWLEREYHAHVDG